MSKQFALITGASSGIGKNLAKIFAENGHDLLIVSQSEKLIATQAEIQASGASVDALRADLSTYDGCEQVWRRVEETGRPLDAAALNAGVGLGGLFVETDLQRELTMVRLNIEAVVHLSKHISRHMVAKGQGRMLLTASMVAEMVSPREAVYSASKAFVLSFAKSLRYELRDTGVTVTALEPGQTNTGFFHRAGMDNTKVGSKALKENDPYKVAKDGFDAMMRGDKHVYGESASTKITGALLGVVPEAVTAAMHDDLAKPLGD